MTILSSLFDNPTGYGRIVRENGLVTSIIEEKEATTEQKQIKEINTGLYIVDNQLLFSALDKIDNNNSKNEYYLTDIVKVLSKSYRVDALLVSYDYHLTGINDLEALEKEIKNGYKGEVLNTIYIGGGTPSSLSLIELRRLLEILNYFNKSSVYEYTMEVNPENITYEKLLLMKKYGINRISMGVETTNNKLLSFLNRKHDYNMVKEKVESYNIFKNVTKYGMILSS